MSDLPTQTVVLSRPGHDNVELQLDLVTSSAVARIFSVSRLRQCSTTLLIVAW